MAAVWRVSHNRTGVKHTKVLWYQAREAGLDLKVYFIALQALCLGILNGSVTNFMSALLKGFGYSSVKSLKMQMPSGVIQFTITMVAGYLNVKVPNILCFTIMARLVPGIAGMIGIATIDLKHQLVLTACAWLQSVFGLNIILVVGAIYMLALMYFQLTLLPVVSCCSECRRTYQTYSFVFYAAGNIVGPFLFISKEAPRYLTAIKTLAGAANVSSPSES